MKRFIDLPLRLAEGNKSSRFDEKQELSTGSVRLVLRTKIYPFCCCSHQFPFYYLRIENAEGYVLIAIYLFVCVLFA